MLYYITFHKQKYAKQDQQRRQSSHKTRTIFSLLYKRQSNHKSINGKKAYFLAVDT